MKCDVYEFSYSGGQPDDVQIKGKTYKCSSGSKPLSLWVKLNWNWFYSRGYQVRSQPLVILCVDCYKKIFGQFPMPSTYEGNEYGSLVTAAEYKAQQENAAKMYSSCY